MRTVIPKNASLVPKNAELMFKGIIYDTYHFKQKMFDDTYQTFEMLKRPDTVLIIAVQNNKLIVLEQQQPGHHEYIDLPGGRHDKPDETELQAAQRELVEETGLAFNSWKLLDVWQPASHIERFIYVFLATDLANQTTPKPDAGEKITVKYYSFEDVKNLACNPKARSLPKHILDKVGSLSELLNLAEYK